MKRDEIINELKAIESNLAAETPARTSVKLRELIARLESKEPPKREREIVTS